MLYVYHFAAAPPVSISWDPSLKLEGQLITTTGDIANSDTITARFKPVSGGGSVSLDAPAAGNIDFQVFVAAAAKGAGQVKIAYGNESQAFDMHSSPGAQIRWPECTLSMIDPAEIGRPAPAVPWQVTTAGNVVMRSEGRQRVDEVEDGQKIVEKEVFRLGAANSSKWLDGTAVLKADFQFITWEFPFCPINTVKWVNSVQAPAPPAKPEPPRAKGLSPAVPAGILLFLILFLVVRRRKKKEKETGEASGAQVPAAQSKKARLRVFDLLMDVIWLAALVVCIGLAVWSSWQIAEARHLNVPALEAAGKFVDGLIKSVRF